MNTKRIGDIGEEIAAEELKRKGYKILERNVELSGVEVDIIAKDKNVYVFCEVKTRNNSSFGRPIEAVTRTKQHRYITAAKAYVVNNRLKNADIRFDVIEILDGEIIHVEGAYFA